MPEREVGQLAGLLVDGYYSHVAALGVAANPRASELMPPRLPGDAVPVGLVSRKDGTVHSFHYEHYLSKGSDPELAAEFARAWLAGSLITLGDALHHHGYFDHGPELELVYHLRNGVAHGNRFNLTPPGVERLRRYPAHNRLAAVRGPEQATFAIDPSVDGQVVLFAFIGAADVLDLLLSVQDYLCRIADGLPGHPPPIT